MAYFINSGCNYERTMNFFEPSRFYTFILLFFNSIILMICPVIRISFISIAISNYNKYNNYIFSKINHGIKKYYKKFPWFIRIDITLLTFELFILIPFFILLIFSLCTILGVYGVKAIDNISEKIKKKKKENRELRNIKKK